jgi:hypothetical protein
LGNLRGGQHAKAPNEYGQYPLDGARETLVALRVIVLETDLELNCLDEVAALFAGRISE